MELRMGVPTALLNGIPVLEIITVELVANVKDF